MKEIPLSKGKVALIDDEDFVLVGHYPWYCDSHGYAVTSSRIKGTRRAEHLPMANLIMGAAKGTIVDHKNRTPLDNQKQNLRVADYSVNNFNRGKQRNGVTSIYTGVCKPTYRLKFAKPWAAYLGSKHIGYFCTEEEAHEAREQSFKTLELT